MEDGFVQPQQVGWLWGGSVRGSAVLSILRSVHAEPPHSPPDIRKKKWAGKVGPRFRPSRESLPFDTDSLFVPHLARPQYVN